MSRCLSILSSRCLSILSWCAVLSAAALLIGCSKPAPTTSPANGSDTTALEEEPSEAEKIAAAMAELSLEDRALAEGQKVCPVSEMLLGSMGTPVKMEHNGQTVFLCCAGCKPDFDADPEMYLAKLSPAGSAE